MIQEYEDDTGIGIRYRRSTYYRKILYLEIDDSGNGRCYSEKR